ncbi:MAG: NAD(P)-binding domain-containing protein [Mycobacteriales bacterium]
MPFPTRASTCPDRLEMADYLEAYAVRFDLPVHTGVRVQGVTPGFAVATSAGPVTARHVVVASGPFHDPLVPTAAADLDPVVPQLHSCDYPGRPTSQPSRGSSRHGSSVSAATAGCRGSGSRRRRRGARRAVRPQPRRRHLRACAAGPAAPR